MLTGAEVSDLPPWLQDIWPKVCFLCCKLREEYDRSTEQKLRNLLEASIPDFATELLQLNFDSQDLHMSFLREALKLKEIKWFVRASQYLSLIHI